MYSVVQASNNSFTAEVLVQNNAQQPQKIVLLARDAYKPYTVYTERTITVGGQQQRNITLTFPLAPEYIEIFTFNPVFYGGKPFNPRQQPIDRSYDAQMSKTLRGVKDCDVWMDADTDEITKFSEWFAVNAGVLSFMSYDANHQLQPFSDYRSSTGKFMIRYMPYLPNIERFTNNIVKSNSPSRVGHDSGRVEVSHEHYITYSVPKRLLINLHEFMHKYGNKKFLDREIGDESGADFLALYIYLGKGYSRIDAKDVFLNIFYKNRTEENILRYKMIERFIADFDSGKINNLINCKTK